MPSAPRHRKATAGFGARAPGTGPRCRRANAPPPGVPGPFALSEEGALRAFAETGELKPGAVLDVDTHWTYADEDAGVRGLGSSGGASRAMAHAGEAAVLEAHRAALAPFRQPDGSFRIGARFRCLVAAP